MPRTMNEQHLRAWTNEVQLSKNELHNFHETCKRNIGKFFHPDNPAAGFSNEIINQFPADWSDPALVTRYVKTKLANLYIQEPEFSLYPEQDLYVSADGVGRDPARMARIFQGGLNHFYKSTNQGEQDTAAIVACLLCGIGMKLHGYHTKYVYNERLDESRWQFGYALGGKPEHFHLVGIGPEGKGRTSTEPKENGHSHKIAAGMILPARFAGREREHTHIFDEVMDPIERQAIVQTFRNLEFDQQPWEYDQFIQKQSPWGKELSVLNALWDPRGKTEAEWTWFGFWDWRQLWDIKHFPLFREAAQGLDSQYYYKGVASAGSGLETVTPSTPDMSHAEYEFDKDYLKHVKVYTLYIKRDIVKPDPTGKNNDKMLVFVEGYEKPLYYGDCPFDLDGYPVSILKWLPSPQRFTTIADVSMWQDVFEDYCHFRSVIMDKLDNMKRFHLVNQALVKSKVNLAEKITNVVDGEAISVDAGQLANLSGLIHTVDDPNIQTDLWNMLSELKTTLDDLAGQNEIGRGGPLGKQATATEIMKFEEARGRLLAIEQASIMRFLRRSGQIYVTMLQQFYSGRTMVEIVSSMGEKEMVPFTRREAMTRCRLEVVPETTVPMDRQFRRWELTNFLQVISQIPIFIDMFGREAWLEFGRALSETYRLPTIANLLRAPSEAVIAQTLQGMQGGQSLLPTGGGMDSILGNVTGAGAGEGGQGAGTVEPMRQGAETLAPTEGHVAGRGF